jgi:methanol:N,N-dimethyl-4-nitrosoaniline oxidoreductase
VITDLSSPKAPHKWVAVDVACSSTLSINDPILQMTQPPEFIAYTGFDTLAHASECYVSRVDHPSALPLALKAIELTAQNLREATYNPRNFTAMNNMCWAQYTAAQAFSSGLLGILHSLSHAVCARYDIHHGLNNGVGLARVWAYNQPAAVRRFADIARAMGEDTTGLSDVQAGDVAIEAGIRLAHDCGIPDNFSSAKPYPKSRIGMGWYEKRPRQIRSDDAELNWMATHMMEDACTPGNARGLTHADAVEILRACVYSDMDSGVMAGLPAGNGQAARQAVTA